MLSPSRAVPNVYPGRCHAVARQSTSDERPDGMERRGLPNCNEPPGYPGMFLRVRVWADMPESPCGVPQALALRVEVDQSEHEHDDDAEAPQDLLGCVSHRVLLLTPPGPSPVRVFIAPFRGHVGKGALMPTSGKPPEVPARGIHLLPQPTRVGPHSRREPVPVELSRLSVRSRDPGRQ